MAPEGLSWGHQRVEAWPDRESEVAGDYGRAGRTGPWETLKAPEGRRPPPVDLDKPGMPAAQLP